jgi:arsenate reductase-like glutaredoxin family protein
LVASYPKDELPAEVRNTILTPVIQIILKQKPSVSDLVKMLSGVEQTEPVTDLIRNLQDLEKTYEALNIDEQIKNNRGDMVLSDKNLVQITEIVSKMRKSITD